MEVSDMPDDMSISDYYEGQTVDTCACGADVIRVLVGSAWSTEHAWPKCALVSSDEFQAIGGHDSK